MIELYTTACVNYTCWLTEEDEQKVREYARENDLDIEDAVNKLYENHELSIYTDSTESDFCTEDIDLLEEYEE